MNKIGSGGQFSSATSAFGLQGYETIEFQPMVMAQLAAAGTNWKFCPAGCLQDSSSTPVSVGTVLTSGSICTSKNKNYQISQASGCQNATGTISIPVGGNLPAVICNSTNGCPAAIGSKTISNKGVITPAQGTCTTSTTSKNTQGQWTYSPAASCSGKPNPLGQPLPPVIWIPKIKGLIDCNAYTGNDKQWCLTGTNTAYPGTGTLWNITQLLASINPVLSALSEFLLTIDAKTATTKTCSNTAQKLEETFISVAAFLSMPVGGMIFEYAGRLIMWVIKKIDQMALLAEIKQGRFQAGQTNWIRSRAVARLRAYKAEWVKEANRIRARYGNKIGEFTKEASEEVKDFQARVRTLLQNKANLSESEKTTLSDLNRLAELDGKIDMANNIEELGNQESMGVLEKSLEGDE